MNAFELTEALGGRWSQSSGKGSARCPAHDDRHASLSLTDSQDGRVLVKCHASCGQDDVLAALTTRGLWGSASPPLVLVPANGVVNGTSGQKIELEPSSSGPTRIE